MSVDAISQPGGKPEMQASQNLELTQVLADNLIYVEHIDGHTISSQFNQALTRFGYCATQDESPFLPSRLAPSIMGSGLAMEVTYRPGIRGSKKMMPADHVHGLTSLIAGAPNLVLTERTRLVKEVVSIASHTPGIDDYERSPKAALSPRQARKAALEQLKSMAAREDFRERNRQAGVISSSELNILRVNLKKEWRFEEDKLAGVVLAAAGAIGLLALRKMLSK